MEMNKLSKANEDFERMKTEIMTKHRWVVKLWTRLDDHTDEREKESMEQEDHQNFVQCYQSNLYEENERSNQFVHNFNSFT